MKNFLAPAELLWEAGENHLNYIKPAAAEMDPPLLANKEESTFTSVALNILDVDMGGLRDPKEFSRFTLGYYLAVRAYDEIVDDLNLYKDKTLTLEDLNTIPVRQKVARGVAHITAREGVQIAMDSASRIIPGNNVGAIRRRNHIEEVIESYATAVADTANNPDFQQGEILDFETVMRSKEAVSAYLGITMIDIFCTLLDKPEDNMSQELFGQGALGMQYIDDIFDWRKDWKLYLDKVQSGRPVRPQENLFNVTLAETPEEQEACEAVLDNSKKSSMTLARRTAPQTHKLYSERFDDLVDSFPAHPHKEKMQRTNRLLYGKLLPLISENGRFNRWAKL